MHDGAHFDLLDEGNGSTCLALQGDLLVSTIGQIDDELRALEGPISRIDLSGAGAVDTVGAWIAVRLERDHGASITGASRQAEVLIDALKSGVSTADIAPPRVPFLRWLPEATGDMVVGFGAGIVRLVSFIGAVITVSARIVRHPSRFRMKALIHQFELVGVNALPIIGLMSFLIGIVIAQQGAVQLRQFGAEVYTVNLTGRLALRELGVLMTAIMVAGRSGSAFAAQLGTMKLTEEVDAMRTIGISPIEALVIPRIMASTFMMVLLGFYSSCLAIIGGAVIADLTLDIPFMTFLSRIQEVVPIHDLWVGLIKAPVFGLIVGLAGCYQGMQVKGNAEEVGLRTTAAVVQAIFMVIVLDAFFAVFFTEVGWG
jgi:phospholipid/cholesterol/gamma-HCH transport system permease protein